MTDTYEIDRLLRDAGIWATVYTNGGDICLRLQPVDADKLRDALKRLNASETPRLAR